MSNPLNNVHEQYADLQAKVEELEADTQRLAYTEEELIEASIEIERLVNAHDKERDRSRKYQQRIEELQATITALTAAPIDNGIPELDAFCQQFNDGKFDLTDLVCRIWNSQQAKVESLTELVASLEEVRAKEYAFKQAKVEKLTKAITDFREGNYPDPRSYRPNNCPHGTHYWQECANCDEEYWQSVLQEGE